MLLARLRFAQFRVHAPCVFPSATSARSAALFFAICLVACANGMFAPAAAAAEKVFRAGAAAVDITPLKYPISMTGSFQDRKATGAHDRLHARAVVLDDGQTKVAIVIVDSALISREIFDAAKKLASDETGIPTERMMAAATHTHTAPTAILLAQCLVDPDYVKYLTKQIGASIVQATKQLEPAKVGWGVGKLPDEVFNRRWKLKTGSISENPLGFTTDRVRTNPGASPDVVEPAGPTDPDLAILSVQALDGRPIALLANYSLHYVGNLPLGMLSADYFGEFARQIAGRLQAANARPAFVGIMSNGTSGDVNNVNVRQPQPRAEPFERIRVVAGKAANVAYDIHESIKHRDWVSLSMAEKEIELGVRRPTPPEIDRALGLIAKIKGPVLTTPELYAKETIRLSEHPPTVRIKLQALRVGELGITANPCEAFVDIGLEIKRKSPLEPTFTICLANGYSGYLPTPEQHALGGYETWRCGWSFLEVEASRKIAKTSLELLEEVAK